MSLSLNDLLNPLRSVIKSFTFTKIKDIAGGAGLKISNLAHLQQKSGSGGASKGQLIDAIEDLLNNESSTSRGEIISSLIKLMCQEDEQIREQVVEILDSFGWEISENNDLNKK